MDSFFEGLNPDQRKAAAHAEGPMLVLAGAGSGKTRVLTHRIAALLERGIPGRSIFAVTFTNKAAAEMRQRVIDMVGASGGRVWLSTFHSACVRMLRRDIQLLGYQRNFNIYDVSDQKRLMKSVLKEHNVVLELESEDGPRSMKLDAAARSFLQYIEQAKQSPRNDAEIESFLATNFEQLVVRVYQHYQVALRRANAIDFNDIINLTVQIWRQYPEVLAQRQSQFQFLLVDEYQDTNPVQYELIRLLASDHQNVMVVGDDDQSIYGFRGADSEIIPRFVEDFEPQIVRLEQNYRSHGNIIAAANALISNNSGRMEKKMWTDAPDGELVDELVGADEYDEARKILARIRQLDAAGYGWQDCAIIYRTNQSARIFDQVFRQEQIPFNLIGAHKFFDRKEIRDVVAYLKLLANPFDKMAFERVVAAPKRGIGPKSVFEIAKISSEDQVDYATALLRWSTLGRGKARLAARALAELIADLRNNILAGASMQSVLEDVLEKSGYRPALRSSVALLRAQLVELDTTIAPLELSLRTAPSLRVERDLRKQLKPLYEQRAKKDELVAEAEGRLENIRQLLEELSELEPRVEEDPSDSDEVSQVSEEPAHHALHFSENESDDSEESFHGVLWLQEILEYIALNAGADQEDGRQNGAVTMLTAHLAKGLEFPVVFVTGLLQGNFPHERSFSDVERNGVEEERRLAYVAFTRARERLIITRPQRYRHQRAWQVNPEKSMFWTEVPKQLRASSLSRSQRNRRPVPRTTPSRSNDWSSILASGSPAEELNAPREEFVDLPSTFCTREIQSLAELQPGLMIQHPTLGLGIVDAISGNGSSLKLQVAFKDFGVRSLLLAYNRQIEIVEL